MKPQYKIISLILIVILLLSFTACSNTDEAYIYLQLDTIPETLDPQIAKTDIELLISQNIYEGLMRFDKTGKLVCAVAESYEKQGLTYTFKIRKDAKWKNGESITAHDFVFAFKRALSNDTAAPYASLLFSIKNATEFLQGKTDNLGAYAQNDRTLIIELSNDDKNFLQVLSYPVAMPCNEKFFYECKGNYGIEYDSIMSNGSYRLTKWSKEIFGIRLYRQDDYDGPVKAENTAVFISYSKDITATDALQNGDADIAFVTSNDVEKFETDDYKISSIQNTVWFLTLSNKLPTNIRKAFSILAGGEIFANNLPSGVTVATSLFPPALTTDAGASGFLTYDLETAKNLYSNAIVSLEDKKLPEDIKLYYYDNGFSKNMVTSIVGHWQNHLGAYINIESVSKPNLLTGQLENQSYYMAVFPVTSQTPSVSEYLSSFGVSYNGGELSQAQLNILSKNNIVPLAFESENVVYKSTLDDIAVRHGGAAFDFALIVKNED